MVEFEGNNLREVPQKILNQALEEQTGDHMRSYFYNYFKD